MSEATMVEFNQRAGYLVKPGTTPAPGVVVIHENQGLTPHIKDVAERLAAEGFLVLAVDVLSPHGGTPADGATAIEQIKSLNDDEVVDTFARGVEYLQSLESCTGKVASVGFCWGGRASALLAARTGGLSAAVVYYGKAPESNEVPNIQCPLLLHYGADDSNVNPTVPAFEEALQANGNAYTRYFYEGAGHAFNNDTRADRYHEPSARLSWGRTVAFLREALA